MALPLMHKKFRRGGGGSLPENMSRFQDLILITFSSPMAQPKEVHFFDIKWKPVSFYVFVNPKFQPQILCSFGDITKNLNKWCLFWYNFKSTL